MEERTILRHVSDLVEEEHALRQAVQHGTVSSETENARLAEIEVELDQCWDLLRRRRAARGGDEEMRPADEVENYLQ